MQQIYLNKLQTWRPGLLLAGLLALALLHPLQAAAAENNPDAADGGAAEIGFVGGSHNNQSTGPIIDGDPYVGAYGDAWEVTLYVGDYKGSYMLWGQQTFEAGKHVPTGERMAFIESLRWMKCDGLKHNANGSFVVGHNIYHKDTPQWSERGEIVAWGTDRDKVKNYVVDPLKAWGSLSPNDAAKIIDQLENPPSPEDLEAGLADGTILDWCVSMEPIQLVKYKTTTVSGGNIRVGHGYEFVKRDELLEGWIKKGRVIQWQYIAEALSNPYINEKVAAGMHNQPWDWTNEKGWHTKDHEKDNYYLFFPNFKQSEIPRDPDIPPPTPTDFDVIWILEQELLANIPVNWDKDDGTNSNLLAENIAEIKIKEKSHKLGGLRIHELRNDGDCTEIIHNDDDEGDCTDDCQECGETLLSGIQCDQYYTFTWTPNPKSKLDEADLKSVANITGAVSSLVNPFANRADPPTKYQMTRDGEVMDLEFSIKNDVFKEYTWQNSYPGGQFAEGYKKQSTYTVDTDHYAQHIGDEPTPFNKGFQVSFNSHRFAKFGAEDNQDIVDVAGGERAFLPLAGYMMDTATNEKYEEWMNKRGLFVRIKWILEEPDSTFRDGMYKGDPGRNFTWGHGGQHGKNDGTEENSDLVWKNEWAWTRQTDHGEHVGVVKAGHPDHVKDEPRDTDTCGDDSSKSAKSADLLESPRACFGRTEIIEDTIQGHRNVNLLRGSNGDLPGDRTRQFNNEGDTEEGVRYFIRENQWKNDRVTFTIPSTIFRFSPTYKMYGDYLLNTTRKDYEDIWMLAADIDEVQFRDVVDFDLQYGQTVVRAPWSRDFDDLKAADPNTKEPINVLKSGSAYHVDTANSKLVVTAVIHHWDETFFEPGSDERRDAEKANEIVDRYTESVFDVLNAISDGDFGFYTNLVGGTTYTSKFRTWTAMNRKIFEGEAFKPQKRGSVEREEMSIPDPEGTYPKLQLTVNTDKGYVQGSKKIYMTEKREEEEEENKIFIDRWEQIKPTAEYRMNGGWTVWDSQKARDGSQELWSDPIILDYIPDQQIYSATRLETVLIKGLGTKEKWYIEDYEGLLITVIRCEAEFPAIRSNPATVYEKLSDFNSDMNQWSPQMVHPIIQMQGIGAKGHGNNIIIPEGSVGAGTYLDMPPFTIYPDGLIDGRPKDIHDWSLCYRPYFFGLRGSLFDNAA